MELLEWQPEEFPALICASKRDFFCTKRCQQYLCWITCPVP